jgi:hypothetical protein
MALPFGCGCLGTTVAEAVNIPGDDGANGVAGVNGYSTLTDPLVLPAIGVNVTATMGSTAWIAYGQFLVVGSTTLGYAHFQVQLLPAKTATTVTLKFLGYPGDALPTVNLPTGSIVSPAGPWGLPAPLTVYGAGTVYPITNAQAAIDMGTTDPSLVITTPGTYLIFARAKIRNNSAATVPGEIVTVNLAKNTAAITGATTAWVCPAIVNGANLFLSDMALPPIVFTTAVATDVVALYAGASVVTNAGAYNVSEAEIVAVRLY